VTFFENILRLQFRILNTKLMSDFNPFNAANELGQLSNSELLDLYNSKKNRVKDLYSQSPDTMLLLLIETQLISRGLLNKSNALYGDLIK
jgi:hypothetical protein